MNQLLNLTTMSKLTQKKIRAYAGVKRNSQLPALLDGGLNITQSLGELGQRYNNEIKQNRKESHRKSQANYVKRQKAIKKLKTLNLLGKIRERIQAKKNALFITLTDNQYSNDALGAVRKIFLNLKGKTVHTQLIHEGATVYEHTFDINDKFSSWWKRESVSLWIDSGRTIFDEYPDGKFFIYQPNTYTNNLIRQQFREGIKNCMLTPIREWAEEKLKESKTKPTISRYNCILEELSKYEIQFKDGVPEDALAEICNTLQIDITVELPFCEKKFIEARSLKKRLKIFKFMNTRLNHVDLNEVVKLDDYEEISSKEMRDLKDKLDVNNEYYTYKKSMNRVSSISTLTKNYRVKDDFTKIIEEFEIFYGLNNCKIDDIDDADLTKFIMEGTNYNGTVDFHEPNHKDIKHIDMEKAYTNSDASNYFEGFLGKITDFRQTDKIEGVGMYRITDLNMEDANPTFKRYNDKMKIYITNNVYTSPELKMLSKMGATFKIVSGCWGIKPIENLDFDNNMMKATEFGTKYYAKWSGVCDSHQLETSFWVKCSPLHFEAIRANCEGVGLRYENGEALFRYKKKHNYHLGHITAFLTAYQRLNTLEQLMNMDYENIYRVCVDGIYFKGETELMNVFRQKDEIKFGNEAGDSYVSQVCKKDLRNTDGSPREMAISRKHYAKELHLGEGGCGKTHINCNDTGLIRTLFVAPSWKLAVSKKRECGINATVWARVLSTDPEKINEIRRYNVLIIDEVSMLTEHQKLQIFKTYKYMKIILCGDLGYQLPCISGEEMKATGFDNIVKHTTDYRCKDLQLKKIKNELREMIEYDRPRNEINYWVVNEFKRLGRVISVDELQNKYDVKDMILSGTNQIKDFYTGLFAGKFSEEKYYVMENNRLYQNGEIIVGEKPTVKCDIRHCFTTHSIQGETAEHKLFIDSERMFDSRMYYTAISRARKLEQIFLIVK